MPQAAVWLEELNLNLDLTSIDWREIITQVVNFLQNGAGNVLNTTFTVASGIFNGIVTGFLAIVFSFYLLMNKEKLGSQTKQLLYALLKEPHADYLVRVSQMTNRTFSKFLSGQCVEAVILATLFFVSMSILAIPVRHDYQHPDCLHRSDSGLRRFHRLCRWRLPHSAGRPGPRLLVCGTVPLPSAV